MSSNAVALRQTRAEAHLFDSAKDPIYHTEKIQGVDTLEPCHKLIMRAIAKHQRVSISACHDIGKTFTLAKIVNWFLSSHAYSVIVTTAPTARQVNHILWSEIRMSHKNSKVPLGGVVYDTPYWKIDDGWFAIGFSPEKIAKRKSSLYYQDEQSSFQGFHATSGNNLIIFDEATGVSPSMWSQVEGMLTSANAKFVCIGNPTSKAGNFFKTFGARSWHNISLDCFDSPNLIVNGFTSIADLKKEVRLLMNMSQADANERMRKYKIVAPYLLTAQFVLTKALPTEWGIDHILFQTKILGNFPEEEEFVLFKTEYLQMAKERELPRYKPKERYIGIDPARGGKDDSVLTHIEGFNVAKYKCLFEPDLAKQTGQIINIINDLPRVDHEVICIDGTGLGSGIVDNLKQAKEEGLLPKHLHIVELHFGVPANDVRDTKEKQKEDTLRYFNLKAKLLDLLKLDLKNSITLCNVDVDKYEAEMPTMIYGYDNRGRLRMESKDEYKARTHGKSPDYTESLAIANYGRHLILNSQAPVPEITIL